MPRETYCLTTQLLATPLHVLTTTDDVVHPQPYTASDACGQWDKAPERSTKKPSKEDDGTKDGNAKTHRTFLQLIKHGFIGD